MVVCRAGTGSVVIAATTLGVRRGLMMTSWSSRNGGYQSRKREGVLHDGIETESTRNE